MSTLSTASWTLESVVDVLQFLRHARGSIRPTLKSPHNALERVLDAFESIKVAHESALESAPDVLKKVFDAPGSVVDALENVQNAFESVRDCPMLVLWNA